MKWYLSKLVFRIICGDGSHIAQFDEQLRIIRAEDELHAFQKARSIGERECMEEHLIRRVQWKFIDVSELYLLSDFIDGAEIYSKITEEEDSDLYIRTTQKRAKQLLQDGLNNFTLLNNIAIGC
jgi:Domain of unknown function (DUF4288)